MGFLTMAITTPLFSRLLIIIVRANEADEADERG